MIGGVPRETAEGEKRVAIVPESVPKIGQLTIEVERDAGAKAGFSDAAFIEAGARVVDDADRLYDDAHRRLSRATGPSQWPPTCYRRSFR